MKENIDIETLIEGLMAGIETREKNIQDAVDEYIEANRSGWKGDTPETYRYRLNRFIIYCETEIEKESLNNLECDDIADFRPYLDDEYKPKSKQDTLKLLRQFLKFAANRLWVPPYFHDFVEIPTIDTEDEVRDEIINYEDLEAALKQLNKFHYASTEHVVVLLIADVGLRLGTMRALDVGDFVKQPYRLKLRHRPETGTRLKHARDSERDVRITDETAEVLQDYIDSKRPSVTDEYGRQPLIASDNGRLSGSMCRKYMYRWTQPCRMGMDCPEGRDPEECDAAQRLDSASQCPESKSLHPGRKGYITYMDAKGVNLQDIADRCDVSPEMIKKHYSKVDKKQEAENRWERILEELDDDSDDGIAAD